MPSDTQLKVGLVGLDTSHVSAFARLLNDSTDPHYVQGASVTVAYPGGSPDFDLSISRVEGYTKELGDKYGVQMVDSPQAVAERCDLLFITTVDGRMHRQHLEDTIAFKRPTFIDKPFAVSASDAQAMLEMADQAGIPLMSCSSLRYADRFQAALSDLDGRIAACTAYGPMNVMAPLEGLYWYGIHPVEMLVAAMGPGCVSVQATRTEHGDMIAMVWDKDRTAMLHGFRNIHGQFGITLHSQDGARFVDPAASGQRPYYASMLEAIIRNLPEGRSDVPAEEMLEVIRIIDAANQSRESGDRVELASVGIC